MTDPLDHDLRATLASRAAEITADAAAGEAAIAARLAAGDAGLAEVVAIRSPRRRPLLVAAALLVVVALAAAALLSRGDDTVDTGPVDDPRAVPAAVLEFRPVLLQGPCFGLSTDTALRSSDDTTCYQVGDPLPGNDLLESTGVAMSFSATGGPIGGDPLQTTTTQAATNEYAVELVLTTDGIAQFNALAAKCFERSSVCPTGQIAIVVDDVVLSAPTVQQPSFDADQIQISGDFTEDEAVALVAALRPLDGGQPPERSFGASATVGDEFESAKDVAERVALGVFGETFVTMGAEDDGALTWVTLEGPGGNAVAEVIYDEGAGGQRVLRISPAGELDVPGTITDGSLSFELPEPGDLTYAILDGDLNELFANTMPGLEGGVVSALGPVGEDPRWISVRLDTPDGRVLVWFRSVGD